MWQMFNVCHSLFFMPSRAQADATGASDVMSERPVGC